MFGTKSPRTELTSEHNCLMEVSKIASHKRTNVVQSLTVKGALSAAGTLSQHLAIKGQPQCVSPPAITGTAHRKKSGQSVCMCEMKWIIRRYTPATQLSRVDSENRIHAAGYTVCDTFRAWPTICCPVHDATSLKLIRRFHHCAAPLSVMLIINRLNTKQTPLDSLCVR